MIDALPYGQGSLPGISLPPIVNSLDNLVGKTSPVSSVHPFATASTDQPVQKLKQLLIMQQKQVQDTLAVLQHAQKVQEETDTLKQIQQMQMQLALPSPNAAALPSPLRNLLQPSPSFNFGAPASPPGSLPLMVSHGLGMHGLPATNVHQPPAEGRPIKRSRSDKDGAEPARKKRIYVKAACVQCRSSHQACDDGFPCRNCMRSGQRCERGQEVNYFVPPSVDNALTEGLDFPKSPSTTKSSSPTQSDGAGEGRRYVKAACSCCRKAHLACDNFRPCRNCAKSGQVCEQVRSQRRTRRPHVESTPAATVTA